MANKNVIQTVKTIAVLVVICLVCCLLLALCNDLLYVTPEEKFNRSMKKVYPQFEKDGDVKLDSKFATNSAYGSILNVYKSKDGVYVLESKGTGGFGGGNVTIYVAISNEQDPKILSWAITANEGQSFIGNISEKHTKEWFVGDSISVTQSTTGKGSGASYTENALNNAINMAAYYCMNALGLGSNPEGDAKAAALALLGESFAAYELEGAHSVLNAKIGSDTVASKLSSENDAVTYFFKGTGDNGDVQVFVYGNDENRKMVAVTENGIVCSDNVQNTDAIVQLIGTNRLVSFKFGSYTAYAMILQVSEAEGNTVYKVAGLKISTVPNTYVLNVTIANNEGAGKVVAIEAETSGYVEGEPAQANTDKLITSLVGTTLATIDGVYSSDKVAGATQSANLITVAVKAALADFDANLVAVE